MITIYKHHIAKDFELGLAPITGGIGRGATIFLNFDFMKKYLQKDGRCWYYCKAIVDENDLIFNFKNKYMATITKPYYSENYKELTL